MKQQKTILSSPHRDTMKHKRTTPGNVLSSPPPTDTSSGPQHNTELREQITNAIIGDPAILKAIVDPIATLLVDKIVNSGLLMGKLADRLLDSKVFVDSIALAMQEKIAKNVYEATSMDINNHAEKLEKLHQQICHIRPKRSSETGTG